MNGVVTDVDAQEAAVEVKECFMHCAKAFIRSDFWKAAPVSNPAGDMRGFVAATRLLFLGTMNAEGTADVSPKGDPAGLLVRFDGDEAWLAERPGNRRADSFRNLLARPHLAAVLLLVPGSNRIATMAGEAEIRSRPDIRQLLTVQGKVPQIATRLARPRLALRESPALERAQLWPVRHEADLDPAAIMAEHVRLSRTRGLQAAVARTTALVPGLMKWGLASDCKRNLCRGSGVPQPFTVKPL